MSYFRVTAASVVSAPTLKDIRAAWKLYGHTGLIKSFRCDVPVTDAQLRRLPKGLRALLT